MIKPSHWCLPSCQPRSRRTSGRSGAHWQTRRSSLSSTSEFQISHIADYKMITTSFSGPRSFASCIWRSTRTTNTNQRRKQNIRRRLRLLLQSRRPVTCQRDWENWRAIAGSLSLSRNNRISSHGRLPAAKNQKRRSWRWWSGSAWPPRRRPAGQDQEGVTQGAPLSTRSQPAQLWAQWTQSASTRIALSRRKFQAQAHNWGSATPCHWAHLPCATNPKPPRSPQGAINLSAPSQTSSPPSRCLSRWWSNSSSSRTSTTMSSR